MKKILKLLLLGALAGWNWTTDLHADSFHLTQTDPNGFILVDGGELDTTALCVVFASAATVTWTGPTNSGTFAVQHSTNLVTWQTVATVPAAGPHVYSTTNLLAQEFFRIQHNKK